MPTNDIKPFAAAGGANVLTQAEYLALAALSTGFSSGKASSKEVNKAIRQATFIASALAQFICDKSGSDVLDDGNVAGLVTKLLSAMNKTSQPLDATLTALAGLVGAANKLPYFNGDDTATLTDLTSVGRDIIGKSAVSDVLTYLGFGSFPQYQNLGAGQHIIQHGSGGTNSSGIIDIVFPKAYTTTDNLNVLATATAATPSNYIVTIGIPTLTGVRIYITGANAGNIPAPMAIGFNWFATGR